MDISTPKTGLAGRWSLFTHVYVYLIFKSIISIGHTPTNLLVTGQNCFTQWPNFVTKKNHDSFPSENPHLELPDLKNMLSEKY